MPELNVLQPTSSDLYPTPDERELLRGVTSDWGDDTGNLHKLIRRRALKALRIGFHANAHDCQAAYERGYATAESDILAKTT